MTDKILPGVYTEENDSGPRPISSIATGVIGMVGTASKGPVDEARQVSSYSEFERIYGGIKTGYNLAENVNTSFQNGAQTIRACRVVGSGAAKSSYTFQDGASADSLEIEAKDYGVSGDNINVKITTGTTGGKVTVVIADDTANITELYQNGDMVKDSDFYLVNRINAESQIVVAEDKDTSGNPAVTVAAGTDLAGGLDGGTVGSGQIIGTTNPLTGLKLLETVDAVNILMVAESIETAVWVELIAQCESLLDRMCILNVASGLTPSQAISASSAYDSKRAIFPYPWLTIYDYTTGSKKNVPASAALAGIISKVPAYVSPSNQSVLGIIGLERALTRSECETLHLARLMPISLITGRGYRLRNGLTLSSNPKWTQICKRRITDKIEESVEEAMSWAISKPHTGVLRDNVKTSISGFLQQLVDGGEIGQGFTVKCDSENNPAASVQAGNLIADIGIEYFYPADKVIFRYSENISEGFTSSQLA